MIRPIVVDVGATVRDLNRFESSQLPYAAMLTLTRLAGDVKAEEERTIRRVFDRPTPFTQNSVFMKPATKANLIAWVGLKDDAAKGTPASKYLAPEVFGGDRRQKRGERALTFRHQQNIGDVWFVPSRAERNAYGNITAGEMQKVLSALQASEHHAGARSNSRARVSGRSQVTFNLQRSNARSGWHYLDSGTAYFIGAPGGGRQPFGVWLRSGPHGRKLRPILLFIKRPSYRVRFQFYDVARQAVQDRVQRIFDLAMREAMATAK